MALFLDSVANIAEYISGKSQFIFLHWTGIMKIYINDIIIHIYLVRIIPPYQLTSINNIRRLLEFILQKTFKATQRARGKEAHIKRCPRELWNWRSPITDGSV
jgi:hypothetical protein